MTIKGVKGSAPTYIYIYRFTHTYIYIYDRRLARPPPWYGPSPPVGLWACGRPPPVECGAVVLLVLLGVLRAGGAQQRAESAQGAPRKRPAQPGAQIRVSVSFRRLQAPEALYL